MGSVIDYIECPNCKQEAYSDFYYKTGEEYVNCNKCGYRYSATIKNRNKKLTELTESDWEINELKNPYGAYRFRSSKIHHDQCGSLANEEQYNLLVTNAEVDVDIEFCSVSKLINGEIVTEVIIDNVSTVDSECKNK